MHLARETDGRDAGKVRRRRLPQGGDGRLDRFPPALGSCSDRSGCGLWTLSVTSASASTACAPSTRTAFTADVPTSMPRKVLTLGSNDEE